MQQLKNWRKWAIHLAILPVAMGPAMALGSFTAKAPEPVAQAETAAAPTSDTEPPSTPLPTAAPTPTPTPEPTATPTPKPVVVKATPKPTAKPVNPTVNTQGVEQYRAIVAQYDWPVDQALAVMKAESGGIPTRVSPTNDHGLMQINWRWQKTRVNKMGGTLQSLYEPEFNIKVAYAIYRESGWCPWYAARKIGVATNCR